MNKISVILGSLIVLLSTAGCNPDTAVPHTILPTRTPKSTETITAIATQPTISASTSTPNSTPTQPLIPTETIQLTSTPHHTVTPVLPDWIAEPSANILLLRSQENQSMVLINVDTGEQREVYKTISNPDPSWLWQEGRYLLNPSSSYVDHEAIDITTGEFVKLPEVNRDTLSPDGRYLARVNIQNDRSEFVTILDHENGTETKLLNPFLHHQTLDEDFIEQVTAHWSPDDTFLSVLYDKHYYSDKSDQNLAIYTPSGELFRQYSNMDTSWKNPWSPVMPHRILYTDGNRFWPPCILDVFENKRTCLEIIDAWSDDQNVSLFNFQWSPDGNQISYVYGASDGSRTGLCYYELATENIVCPITAKDLQIDDQLFARILFWSPDGKFLVLFFDEWGFMDVIGNLRVAVVDIDGQNFQLLEGEYSWPSSNPWRPPIPSKTDY